MARSPRSPRLRILAVGVVALAAVSAYAAAATAQANPAPSSSYNGLALTPPMGFNDWNAFGCNVSESVIEQTALAMHENGMQAAGYDYVNIDDCWMKGRDITNNPAAKVAAGRDANGHLIADPTYFPDGIKAVADYVHSLGLKLGIYEDIGTATCQGLAGSYGHEATDAQDFARWGVDYLKYDDCNLPPRIPPTPAGYEAAYKLMSDALRATGRPIIYSICEHTEAGESWLWGGSMSNLWRTTTDIRANFASMLTNFTKNSVLAQYAGPGHWNDPDMLEIGTGTMTKLAAPAAAGDTTIKVASISSAVPGSPITIGSTTGGDLESRTVASVGTAATTTTLFESTAAGDTNVKVASTNGVTVGGPITVGTGSGAQSATVTAVGTAGGTGTLFTAANAGDTNVKVTSVTGATVGQPITIGTESPTVAAVGTPATTTTLSAASSAGDTNIKVASVANISVGDQLAIDTGTNQELVTVTSVGTAGATGTGLGITPALQLAHSGGFRGATVADLSKPGTGITLSTPLAEAHAAGTTTRADGTGISFTPALQSAYPSGTTVVGPTGTGITLTQPLSGAHASGSNVGISGMTVPESMSEMSLWAMEAAPLIAGTDVVNMASQNVPIYTNPNVIAIDQDPLGMQANVVSNANGNWVLTKPLANGDTAVMLFNAADTPWTDAAVSLSDLGLPGSRPYSARDLWTGTTLTIRSGLSAGTIAPHASMLLRIAKAHANS